MVENRRGLAILSHLLLIGSVALICLPIWIAFVASTHTSEAMMAVPIPLLPSSHLLENYAEVLGSGVRATGGAPVWRMLMNSMIMATAIAAGKIAISLLSAFAIVYFRFPLRMFCFWTIFATLMLPVEVRIMPTYKVIVDLGLLDSYAGLTVPLMASATATFLFRQFFLTVPDELLEAARIDGAGPIRFLLDILMPLSRTNIAALAVILFIYGWNQYLWPLLVTTDERFYTIVMAIQRMAYVSDAVPQWHLVMAVAVLSMLPPVAVVVLLQRQFVRGLVETEK